MTLTALRAEPRYMYIYMCDTTNDIAAAIDEAVAVAAQPKKLGRPPKGKKKKAPLVAPVGVVQAPEIADALFEMHCDEPMLFKKLFNVLKKYHVSEIELVIDQPGITIETASNDGTVVIHARVNAAHMARYFTTQPFRIWLSVNELVSKFDEVGSSHHMVKFMLCNATKGETLHVILSESDCGTDTFHTVACFKPAQLPTIAAMSDADYPLKFPVKHAHLKKKLTGTTKNQVRGALIIQKIGTGHVQMSIEKDGKDGGATVYAKTETKSTMTAEDLLYVKIPTSALKGIFAQAIGPDVNICAVDKFVSFTNYALGARDGVVMELKIYIPAIA